MNGSPLLHISDLHVRYRLPAEDLLGSATLVDAVKGASFDLAMGETVGLVGESGSGKSTLARAILGLIPAHAGQIEFTGGALPAGKVQMVFQNPVASLNPQMTVASIVAEPLRIGGAFGNGNSDERVAEMLQRCGLDPGIGSRYAHELSGGQCQRVAIARALITDPSLLICDEAVSALDVSIQAQIVNLLRELCATTNVAMLFISHDLSVVRYLCERVLVMYRGRIVEDAPASLLFSQPQHSYTRQLLESAKGLRAAG